MGVRVVQHRVTVVAHLVGWDTYGVGFLNRLAMGRDQVGSAYPPPGDSDPLPGWGLPTAELVVCRTVRH